MRHSRLIRPHHASSPAFIITIYANRQPRPDAQTSSRRPRHIPPSTSSPPLFPRSVLSPTRLQQTRLRLHLLHLARKAQRSSTKATSHPSDSEDLFSLPTPPFPSKKHVYSPAERRARSERLRERWRDPQWRATMLERRKRADTVRKMSDSAKRLWQDPVYRTRMRQARLGRPAPNKGVSPSLVTRLRMSVTRKGVPVSDATKKKMSVAKLKRPEGDDWPRLISESKRGKTKEYFQMRREFRALHRDLKLWSDSYRSRYGKLPSTTSYQRFVAPMMLFRIKRYIVLRDAIGEDESDVPDIISGR